MEIQRRENDVKKSELNPLESLADDTVINILVLLAISANSPCKRFHDLVMHPFVLIKPSWKCFPLTPSKWSHSAYRLLKHCADSENIEANYTLGMIKYYCLGDREGGLYHITKAGKRSHTLALYSMRVIKLHGTPTNIISDASKCLTAATLGNLDAIREIGYLYNGGIGVEMNIGEAMKVYENVSFMEKLVHYREEKEKLYYDCLGQIKGPNPVNHFMVEWYKTRKNKENEELKVCFDAACGRVETKAGQFKKYHACDSPSCSHVCRFRYFDMNTIVMRT